MALSLPFYLVRADRASLQRKSPSGLLIIQLSTIRIRLFHMCRSLNELEDWLGFSLVTCPVSLSFFVCLRSCRFDSSKGRGSRGLKSSLLTKYFQLNVWKSVVVLQGHVKMRAHYKSWSRFGPLSGEKLHASSSM